MTYSDPDKRRASWRRWYNRTKNSPHQRAKRAERRRLSKQRHGDPRQPVARRVSELKVQCGCSLCGERHPAVLQFHHVRGEKEFEISTAVSQNMKWERIAKEIEKCDVLCANCHLKKHPRRPRREVAPRARGKKLFDEI